MKKRLILTSFHYHQRLSRGKLCFMSTASQSLLSVIYQNWYILHTVKCRAGPLLFFYCLVATEAWTADITGLPTPHTHPVLLLFTTFYSFFPLVQLFYLLLISWHSHFYLSFTSVLSFLRSPSLYLLLRSCPQVSDRFLTFQGRGSWQLRKVGG